ncbi:MAG: hypothetical protein MUC44_07800 [Beijerinckiaceae bacterium]|jgi:hypothetical protein|nr:hypothetical protein [Beijerinckiaceae bacterium]
MLSENPKVKSLLDYRMQAVFGLMWALELRSCWDRAPPFSILVNERLIVEGNLSAITNPMMEAGFLHCRALLEFLGLQASEKGNAGSVKLVELKKRRNDDVGIEHFKNADGPLKILSPHVALSRYRGPAEDAEKSFLSIFKIANKHLLHNTTAFFDDDDNPHGVNVAVHGIPALMKSYFYTPLGLLPPTPWITVRSREEP